MALLVTDEIDFGLDPITGDFPPPGQDIVASSGLAAVVQGARIRLGLTAGELFFDLDRGVARFNRPGVDPTRVIFGAKFSAARAQREYRRALVGGDGYEGVPGLSLLLQLQVTFDNHTREQFVVWQGRTIWGDTPTDTLVLSASGKAI